MAALPDDWTLPEVTPLTEAWFTSGTLAVQTCRGCGIRQHPPEEICHRCGSFDLGSEVLGGDGVVHSHTVVHYPVHPALAGAVPYVVALVELVDDPSIRVVANLVGVDPADVVIGLPVRAVWEERTDAAGTVLLLQWEAVGQSRR